MRKMEFAILPTGWITDPGKLGLGSFKWQPREGARNVAALMLLIVMSHRADRHTGRMSVTYDDFQAATGLSRGKIAAGLNKLQASGLIKRLSAQSSYLLVGIEEGLPWGKVPDKGLYTRDTIPAFHNFTLRSPVELDALKVYLAIIARRDNGTNWARMNYDKLSALSTVPEGRLKKALSFLTANGLVVIDHVPSQTRSEGISNAYRMPQIYPYKNAGTMRVGAEGH